MSALLILCGSYLAVSPGVDIFLLPKLALIFAGAALSPNPRLARKQRRLRFPFLILIAAASLSAAASASPWQSFLGTQNSPTMGVLGLLAAWASYEAAEPGHSDAVLWGAGICSVVALAQYWVGLPPIGWRTFGTIGAPPFMAGMLALAVPLAWGRPWLVALLLAAIASSGSRSGAIGAVAGLAWLLLDRRGRLLAAGALALVAVVWSLRPQGDSMRVQTWAVALQAWWGAPWLGVGPDCFTDAFMRLRGPGWAASAAAVQDNAHNLPLHVMATQGVIGVLAWGYWGARAPWTASLVAVLAYGMFSPVPFMAWCVLAWMAGACES